jgi:hypothetical protein
LPFGTRFGLLAMSRLFSAFRPMLWALCAPLLAAEPFPTPYNTEKGEPMPAEEAARTMQLPPGFKCMVFAAEPDVQQPIGMAWDSKGRLWVAECYTYAENPDRWDLKLRDRLIVLEDKDGDGKHDSRRVFWDEGRYLTSVEVGHGGVWILHDGTLSFIPDADGDDVPDGPPQVKLDGFNTKTIGHNIVNGLRWGPDGWLYGRHGITDTSAVGAPGTPADQRVRFNCAIWRYHPTRGVVEAVAHGGTNSWGHDWNADGELFMINTVIGHLWHVIPGAYYRRMFGTHLNPYVYCRSLPLGHRRGEMERHSPGRQQQDPEAWWRSRACRHAHLPRRPLAEGVPRPNVHVQPARQPHQRRSPGAPGLRLCRQARAGFHASQGHLVPRHRPADRSRWQCVCRRLERQRRVP